MLERKVGFFLPLSTTLTLSTHNSGKDGNREWQDGVEILQSGLAKRKVKEPSLVEIQNFVCYTKLDILLYCFYDQKNE